MWDANKDLKIYWDTFKKEMEESEMALVGNKIEQIVTDEVHDKVFANARGGGKTWATEQFMTKQLSVDDIIAKWGNDKPYKKVIYNPPATIVIWNDDTKTIVKTTDGEKFDPERGFLQAYYEKHNGITKTQGNKILHELREQYEKGLEK
jgi:hypothetical protein